MASGVKLVTRAVACVLQAMSVLMVALLYNLLIVLLAPMQHMGLGYAPIAHWVSITPQIKLGKIIKLIQPTNYTLAAMLSSVEVVVMFIKKLGAMIALSMLNVMYTPS